MNATTVGTLAQAAIAASVADGAVAAAISSAMSDVDKFWLLFGVCLVLIMQAGFMLLEVGCVREKNTKNILMKNLLDPCIGAVCWWTVGYGFAFGNTNKDDTSSAFIGRGQWFTSIDETNAGAANMWTTDGNNMTWWLFQWAFCATAGTIVSGSVAERMQFAGYITYTAVLTALVYPVVVHWAWSGNGWASKIQVGDDVIAVIDFAGSGVVHMVGGIAGLVGAYMLGPRIGWTKEKGIDGQNAVYTCLGTFMLW
jgi:Amt family ammonium transporter